MMTSSDALVTKVHAESLGYFKDPYAAEFLDRKKKMMPIINRGTWTRVYALRQIINQFLTLNAESKVNILSLGAGYDSTFWWLKSNGGLSDCI
jgi:O-methyltransferase involved in polyketide biosynthesis